MYLCIHFAIKYWVLHNLGIVRATNIIYSQAVFTMIISYLILHEHITLMAITGTFILEESIYLLGCVATAISIHNLYNTIAIMSRGNKKKGVLLACFKNKA